MVTVVEGGAVLALASTTADARDAPPKVDKRILKPLIYLYANAIISSVRLS